MNLKESSAAAVLVVLLAAAGYGVVYTSHEAGSAGAVGTRLSSGDSSVVVDQGSLLTAQRLVRLPTTADERPLAEGALRIGDQEMDLAFAEAVRGMATRPPAVTRDAQESGARLQQALTRLAADQARVDQLTKDAGKANPLEANALGDRLELAKAQVALDQDEADDAKQDLMRAGGDPQGRVQELVAQHEAASKSSDSTRVTVTAAGDAPGLVHYARTWSTLRQKRLLLVQARLQAESTAVAFGKRHDAIEALASTQRADAPHGALSHDSSAALLATTRRRAVDEKTKASLDQRADNQRRLADIYAQWMQVVAGQQRAVVNRALTGVVLLLAFLLLAVLFEKWVPHGLGLLSIDPRRKQTLHLASRLSLQVAGALLILLVTLGPPDNLGVFLGLAGAGLTVVLRYFIIAFLGWFVLMGRNGLRTGDIVEINGVTGEVVRLGVFRTVLAETGSWSDSGRPTGRRVTFSNSFAIEGHYFNFSTSGKWFWDEVRIVVPTGHDPYPVVEAIRKQVEEATGDSAREAEREWKAAERSPFQSALAAAPAVDVKPILGGMEITCRYITRVEDRSELSARLYRVAVDLLGAKDGAAGTA